MKFLSQLQEGDVANIKSIMEGPAKIKLMELGCVPNERIKVVGKAAFNGPIAIEVAGYVLSMRLTEAVSIEVM